MKYILHPKLILNVSTKNKGYIKYFENEYSRLSNYSAEANAVEINVHIVNKLPRAGKSDRKRKIYFKRVLKQEFIVRNLDTSKVEIYYKDHLAGKIYSKTLTLFLQTNVIEPIMYLKLLEKNVLLMHAAGVSDGKHGYLFPAYGGTGKTTLTLGLMAEDMSVLGDDLILVDVKEGIANPYLRPLHLFAYNIKTLRDAIIPLSLKLKIKVKDILRFILEKLTRQEFLIATRVHADSLFPNFKQAKSVKIRKLVFLRRTGGHEPIALTDKKIDHLAQTVLSSEDLNDSLYGFILDKDEVDSVRQMELKLIRQLIENVGRFEFVNTRVLDFNKLEDFKRKLVG